MDSIISRNAPSRKVSMASIQKVLSSCGNFFEEQKKQGTIHTKIDDNDLVPDL
jgi:hypothetical protein